jgi:hypothetical protein
VPAYALWELAKIDPDVIAGVSQASAVVDGSHVVGDSYTAFLSYVGDHAESLMGAGNFNRLAGYVGEQRVAGLLEAQGENVTMALAANNPGWDLLVNGAAANVKAYQDATNALPFAEADHSTHFYLPEDAAQQVPMDNVTYLEGFRVSEVRDSLEESVESAQSFLDGGYIDDAAFGGLPVALLAVTTYKQTILVKEGKRLEDALRDGAIDVTARAVGAIAGMKSGALAGGAIDAAAGGATMGAAAFTGGLIGGVSGSRLGGWAVKEYRLRPLRRAEADLVETLEAYGCAVADAGGLEVMEAAINAPLVSMDSSARELRRRVGRDRRGLRWWLWPGADQVIREVALQRGLAECEHTRRTVEAQAAFWSEVIESSAGPAAIGLTFSNIPELGARTGLTEAYVRDIERAKRAADVARKDLQDRG